jgi:uncharacterized membrane protein
MLKQEAKQNFKAQYGMALLISFLPSAALAAIGITGIGLILLLPVQVGMAYAFIQINRNEVTGLQAILKGFTPEGYINHVIQLFLTSVFIFLWALLLIIPGIIKAYAYALVPYLLADEEIQETDVITLSRRMMNGHKGQLFWLHLTFIGWFILSALTLGLLFVLYVHPYLQSATARFYQEVKKNYQG